MKTYTIPCFLLPQNFNETVLLEWLEKWFHSNNKTAGKYCVQFEFPFHDREYFYQLEAASYNLGKGSHKDGFLWKSTPLNNGIIPVITVFVTVPQ